MKNMLAGNLSNDGYAAAALCERRNAAPAKRGFSEGRMLLRTHTLHLKTIERAKAYLLEHFRTDITLAQLARHCYVSHFYFTRLFKQLTGVSPFHYLQQIRLRYAASLLLHSDLTVAEICFQSGFKRPDYFSTLFTKTFELSPAKYRLANKCVVHAQGETKATPQEVNA